MGVGVGDGEEESPDDRMEISVPEQEAQSHGTLGQKDPGPTHQFVFVPVNHPYGAHALDQAQRKKQRQGKVGRK